MTPALAEDDARLQIVFITLLQIYFSQHLNAWFSLSIWLYFKGEEMFQEGIFVLVSTNNSTVAIQ